MREKKGSWFCTLPTSVGILDQRFESVRRVIAHVRVYFDLHIDNCLASRFTHDSFIMVIRHFSLTVESFSEKNIIASGEKMQSHIEYI